MIRITLEKAEYFGWNGLPVPARTQIREFEDHYAAADWFIHDSYFSETYTTKAVWEIVDAEAQADQIQAIADKMHDSLVQLGVDPDERPEHGGRSVGEVLAHIALAAVK